MQDAAEAGNPGGVIEAFERDPVNPQDYFAEFQQSLLRALENGTDADPSATIQFLLGRALVFDSWLLLRAQHHLKREVKRIDEMAPQNDGSLPESIASEWLPRIERLGREVKEDCLLFSKVFHVMELAEARARASGKIIPFGRVQSKGQTGKGDDAPVAAP
jgi:hypothetical protein